MGLASNLNKKGMTLLGDCLAVGGKLTARGRAYECVTESAATQNDYFIKRGSQNTSDNQGRHGGKGSRNCTAQAAAHGTARQGAPCTEKAKKI